MKRRSRTRQVESNVEGSTIKVIKELKTKVINEKMHDIIRVQHKRTRNTENYSKVYHRESEPSIHEKVRLYTVF